MTAHEFGHNWGSEHDPDVAECSPAASQGGSYLMYTYSVSGYDVNNKVGFCLYIILLSCQNEMYPRDNYSCDF